MKPEITDISFSTALTFELVTHWRICKIRPNLGFDAIALWLEISPLDGQATTGQGTSLQCTKTARNAVAVRLGALGQPKLALNPVTCIKKEVSSFTPVS